LVWWAGIFAHIARSCRHLIDIIKEGRKYTHETRVLVFQKAQAHAIIIALELAFWNKKRGGNMSEVALSKAEALYTIGLLVTRRSSPGHAGFSGALWQRRRTTSLFPSCTFLCDVMSESIMLAYAFCGERGFSHGRIFGL
jgi:hypothetical protein